MQEVSVAQMMMAREARAGMQMQLLGAHPGAVLVCLTMNIAGPVKTDAQIERAFLWGISRVRAVLAAHRTHFDRDVHAVTGPEAIIAVEGDAGEIKRRLCALEDASPLGRLLDIDVIGPDGEKRSRMQLGLPPRRCLICEREAALCARSRAHSVQALFDRTHEIIRAHFDAQRAARCGMLAERALLCEAAITPKPGLVDRANNGAHRDMDAFTFAASATALRGYFEQCARIGMANRGGDPAACFDALRTPGLLAEADMRAASGGVNTHKGAIFSLGIACAALGMGEEGEAARDTLMRCGAMTATRMAQELAAAAAGGGATFGQRLYRASGVGGVRAEAAAGFPGVRQAGLPALRRALRCGLAINEAGLCALCALMACTQDTNAVRRGGEAGAAALRDRARAMCAWMDGELSTLERGEGSAAAFGQRLRGRMAAWDDELIAQNISPGGCALNAGRRKAP